ncbi:MAG TPA: aconitate hydratase [Myxococcota bacterium]|nr:aconitate hydratase [Myxococcota bacterium]HRY94705.1 aconitate hydratase [Myxococcota bacterium]HSA21305.1 aconitate hydratase [Myxococcota bacterium]
MGSNTIYAILEKHRVHGRIGPGEEIGVRADQLLTQDGTGTMVFLHLEQLGRPRAKNRLAVCYVDHNTLGDGPENADDHAFLQAACEKFQVHFSRPGNGIGHQLHLERFAAPGLLLLGADSHVPTLGGIGELAIGVGGLELAVALTGAPHYLICPAVTRVVLTGKLRPFCSAKDLGLHILGLLGGRQNAGVALEYTGPGVKGLSVQERATLANLGAELGLTTSLFPADEVTQAFLTAQGRTRDYRRQQPPKGAEYAEQISVDLDKIEPMVALPSSPLKVTTVREAAGVSVQQVAIGSCTNGSYEDLARVAAILGGRRVSPEVSVVVAPASRQALRTLLEQRQLAPLLDAGCRLTESTCGFCIGHGQAPGTGWVSVRTSSRNYPGRCGTAGAQVYLVSPETAAATALRGVLTDPRDLKLRAPAPRAVRRYPVDDGLLLPPPRRVRLGELPRGPNIVDPPRQKPLPASLHVEVSLKLGDHVSTDEILPAGRWLKYRSNVQEYAKHTFEGIDPTFVQRARENAAREICNLIVAGNHYGEGSSREHAAMCPALLGVRVILAKSFERIHLGNLINHGVVPLTFLDQRTYEALTLDDYFEMPWIAAELKKSETITLRNPDRGIEFKVRHGLSRRQIEILLAGGLANHAARHLI